LCPSWADGLRLLDAGRGAVRHLVGDGAALRAGRVGELRLLRQPSCWYWGLKLYLITAPEGMPVAWCLADPKLGGREVAAQELLGYARDIGDCARG
jgi:hypothetical protein